MQVIYFIIYLLVLAIWALLLPPLYFSPMEKRYIFIIGAVAGWRYSWAIFNMVRSVFYKKYYFPRIRKKAQEVAEESMPERVFIIITTYRIDVDISAKVYRAAIKEAIECGLPVTIIASVVEKIEENLVKNVFKVLNPPSRVKLIITRFAGTGKRDGLAVAFRTLTSDYAKLQNSIVALVDGDSVLTSGSIKKCAQLFALNTDLGALTTNEECLLTPGRFSDRLYLRWYTLRFAQRDTYMSSLALSKRVLTLTGRMSVYRGEIFWDREFVETVQHDYIEHWRLGWFRFLTGDDKSTWYYLLKNGWEMTYVPDVMVYTLESPPHPNFLKGATMLMHRWFGNSLRATYRAMRVPRRIIGPFIWYAIRDQRVTMWTGLYGMLAALLADLKWGGGLFFAYLWWIMFTRLLVSLFYATQRKRLFITWPIFLYFNQIYGSLVKIYILNHLYRQKWTRQKTVLSGNETRWTRFYVIYTSYAQLLAEVFLFIIITGASVGFFNSQDFYNLFNTFI